MQYSEIVYLVRQEEPRGDDIGNMESPFEYYEKIYAKKQSVRTNEFYNATMNGLTPSCEFVIKRLNYNNEDELIWNNERYQVIRTIDPKSKFDIVLVCTRKIGING